jgi:hypothetical protein
MRFSSVSQSQSQSQYRVRRQLQEALRSDPFSVRFKGLSIARKGRLGLGDTSSHFFASWTTVFLVPGTVCQFVN